MANEYNPDKKIVSELKQLRKGWFGELLDTLTWYWLVQIKRKFKIIWAIILGSCSFILVISEITIFLDIKFSLFGWLIRLCDSYESISIVTFIILYFITFSVYYGLFRINIAGILGNFKV